MEQSELRIDGVLGSLANRRSTHFAFWAFYELRLYAVLRSSAIRLCEAHTIPIDSLRVFSESAAIVCLFGARRLSQQSYTFFPEP